MLTLKPCPFCGGHPRLVANLYREGQAAQIHCDQCKATMDFDGWGDDIHELIDNAISEWNRRTTQEPED